MPSLNAGQQKIYDLVVNQRLSVFYGGEAGTGKTTVADEMIKALTEAGVNVCVCASTGQAAQHLEDGFTIHMLFGLRPSKTKDGPSQKAGTWPMKEALQGAKVIFVDEVSMLNEQLFHDMNERLCLMHGSSQPFGGVQVVALGDFLQLPPVEGRFCFHSSIFTALFEDRCFVLKQQMRQGEDLEFAQLLSQVRLGNCTYGVKSCLRQRLVDEARAPPARDVTYLYCLRNQVELKNNTCLDQLPFERQTWAAYDWTLSPEFARTLQSCILEDTLCLKTGAPVILRKNIDARKRLVNGTRGMVTGVATLCELGLRTSCTLDTCSHTAMETPYPVLGDVNQRFERLPVVEFHGETYAVGVSTITKHRGSQREGRKRKVDDSGDVPPEGGQKGDKVAERTQIPLTLAFALTVHKSQGMTLPKVCFQWNNAFDSGQIYVALSRVRQLNDLYIISSYVPEARIKAAPDALEFERTRVTALG